jgi:hypothetical protein
MDSAIGTKVAYSKVFLLPVMFSSISEPGCGQLTTVGIRTLIPANFVISTTLSCCLCQKNSLI